MRMQQRQPAARSFRHSATGAVLLAGWVAGTVDIGAAALIFTVHPAIIMQAIASGVLGRAAFLGGAASAALGLLLQWLMSWIIAAAYVAAARQWPSLGRHWIRCGLLYGVVVFGVMNYVVVPLSAAYPRHAFTLRTFVESLLAMLLFGVLVAFFARRTWLTAATEQ
jgi:uncharacterized membrane protein YagU involved in acid resistance